MIYLLTDQIVQNKFGSHLGTTSPQWVTIDMEQGDMLAAFTARDRAIEFAKSEMLGRIAWVQLEPARAVAIVEAMRGVVAGVIHDPGFPDQKSEAVEAFLNRLRTSPPPANLN